MDGFERGACCATRARVLWRTAASASLAFVRDGCFSWVVGVTLAANLRVDFAFGAINWGGLELLAVIAVFLQLFFGILLHLYTGRYVEDTFEDVRAAAATFLATGLHPYNLTFDHSLGNIDFKSKTVPSSPLSKSRRSSSFSARYSACGTATATAS